jgi:kynurenine formamidase
MTSEQDGPRHIWSTGERLSTWGAHGPDDEKGSLNHITAEHRVAAARLVRRGVVFSLAVPIKNGTGPMGHNPVGRFNPLHHMTATGDTRGPLDMGAGADFSDDVLVIGCHATTHWDALSHVYYGDRLYNGYSASDVDATGARRNGIDKVHSEFVSRGVLLDVARSKSVDVLPAGYAITPEDLTICAERQGVEVGAGDIVLVRTGALGHVAGDDWSAFHAHPRPGLHYSTAEWMLEHRVAAVAADNSGVEAPSTLEGVRNPLHMLALRDLGVHLGEYWYLEELADDCASDGRFDFMLVAQPLRIHGGVGSPINPLAIK